MFDFETQQDLQVGENQYGPIFKQVCNMGVAYRLCDLWKDQPIGICVNCGPNRHIFKGNNWLNDFGNWFVSEENKGATAIAHSANGFDSQFLLEYLHEQRTVKPKIITRSKLYCKLNSRGTLFEMEHLISRSWSAYVTCCWCSSDRHSQLFAYAFECFPKNILNSGIEKGSFSTFFQHNGQLGILWTSSRYWILWPQQLRREIELNWLSGNSLYYLIWLKTTNL